MDNRSTTAQPQRLEPNVLLCETAIPDELKPLDQWVCWKYVTRDGKRTKPPFRADGAGEASSTDPTTWSTLDAVIHACRRGSAFSGIGFVFTEDDPYTGVDLDDAIDIETGELKPWAERIVKRLDSYTEISPSGQGVKIFIRAAKPGKRCKTAYKDGAVEVYDKARFFTTTGRHLAGTPTTIEDRQAQLEQIYNHVFKKPKLTTSKPTAPAPASGPPPAIDDQEIVSLASRQRRTGAQFADLYNTGNWKTYFGSQSEADGWLAFKLAYYTKDHAQLDRLMRNSALMREKWDERRGELTYGEKTLDGALSQVTSQYRPSNRLVQINTSETPKPDSPPPRSHDLVPLGKRDPKSGQLVLSSRRTLPTGEAFEREHYLHGGVRTLHNYADMLMAWRGGRYMEIEDAMVRNQLQPWLHDAQKYIQKKSGELELVDFDANPTTLNAALQTVRDRVYLPVTTPSPSWLTDDDSLPPADELLPCRSALLHLPTNTYLPPNPRLFNINALDFDPDPEATMPEDWFRFLDQLFGDDEESVHLLQEWFGYCLTGDTSQQKMMLMVGPKRSGKGTIGRVLNKLVGEGNVCGPTTSSLAGNFGLQPLLGKSLAIVSDARFAGDSIQTVIERLLCISGEDALTVDRKHKTSVTMKLPTRFMFMSNELPRLSDASGALAGRFVILQMTKSFYGHEDRGLTARLLEDLPGILNWSIEGWKRLRQRGHFVQPESVQDAMQELEDLGSPVGAFIRERCVLGSGYRIDVDTLYRSYRQWCEVEGRQAISTKTVFGRDILAAAPGVRTRRNQVVGRFYEGMMLSGEGI